MLRIDLFWHYKPRKENLDQQEFIGGIFHAAKHFSINRVNLTTGNDRHDIDSIENLIDIEAFFIIEGKFENESTLVSYLPLDNTYHLKFVFYYEPKTDVFFINTIYKEPKSKSIGVS